MSDHRKMIRKKTDELVDCISKKIKKPKKYVANEMFLYIQKHKEWGRNASKAHKRASFKQYNGICQECAKPIDSFDAATFHHKKRNIPRQHEPDNLVPQHQDCHDKKHGAAKGSLLKGSQKRK